MEVPRRLPDPTQDEIAASAALCAQIAREVSALGGFMPFERFMEMALFEPPYGYYVGGAHKFGAAGDFLTAPEISPLFGRAVAAQCVAAQVYGIKTRVSYPSTPVEFRCFGEWVLGLVFPCFSVAIVVS